MIRNEAQGAKNIVIKPQGGRMYLILYKNKFFETKINKILFTIYFVLVITKVEFILTKNVLSLNYFLER